MKPNEALIRAVLMAIGEDPDRPGLVDTPARVAASWEEIYGGYYVDPSDFLRLFEEAGSEALDEMVLVKNIPIHSTCEHHMLPFSGVMHAAYIPAGRVLGLSKFARIADCFARRLQVQERLTNQIADFLHSGLKGLGVGVMIECAHSCMACRGVMVSGSTTVTSALRGVFREKPEVRAEFLSLLPR